MTTITVTTQAELDAALKKARKSPSTVDVLIDSPAGVWLDLTDTGEVWVRASGSATVRASGSATVRASGSATVRASGSATVRASGSATVRAYGSATASAYDSATASAYDSATVRAYDSATVSAYGSATVRAYDSATVRAYGSATASAYDSATVRAYDSATVRAYDSATVRASGSATVSAYDSATVRAYDSATVRASKYAAVHLHSKRVTVTGGVLIDVADLNLADPATWAEYTGATVTDGTVTLYKATDDTGTAGQDHGRPTTYAVGEDVTAPDWRDDNDCGGGLHASPHPHQALAYRPNATRMFEVTVALADLRPIPGGDAKAKARTLHVVREVTLTGAPLPEAVAA